MALRRQLNSTEKSAIATISCTEERLFKIPQLPALRAVVREPAPQKRRFFLLLFLSSLGNGPRASESSSTKVRTAPQIRPEPADRGRDSAPPAIGAHNGSHGQTGVMVVFVLSPLGLGQLLLANSIAILTTGRGAFLLSTFGPCPQSGCGLLPGKGVRLPLAASQTLCLPHPWVGKIVPPAGCC